MNTILEFPLTSEETTIEAPIERFLTVQLKNNIPYIWGIVNLGRVARKYKIVAISTEEEYQKVNASKYIGTLQIDDREWHYFWENILEFKETKGPVFSMFSSR